MSRRHKGGDRSSRAVPSAEDIEITKRALYLLTRHLSDEERGRFGLELLDGVRSEGVQLGTVIDDWVTTIRLRAHPDFESQAKEYANLVQSGELWEGTSRDL